MLRWYFWLSPHKKCILFHIPIETGAVTHERNSDTYGFPKEKEENVWNMGEYVSMWISNSDCSFSGVVVARSFIMLEGKWSHRWLQAYTICNAKKSSFAKFYCLNTTFSFLSLARSPWKWDLTIMYGKAWSLQRRQKAVKKIGYLAPPRQGSARTAELTWLISH